MSTDQFKTGYKYVKLVLTPIFQWCKEFLTDYLFINLFATCVCTLGCPKMHLFPWNIPRPGAKESLSDVGFENISFFNFIAQHFLWIYIIFHILTQPKNPWNFLKEFSAALFIDCAHEKNLRMRTMYFLVLVFEHCSLE